MRAAHVRIGQGVRTELEEARLVGFGAELRETLGGLFAEAGEKTALIPHLFVVGDGAVLVGRGLFLGALDKGLESVFALVELGRQELLHGAHVELAVLGGHPPEIGAVSAGDDHQLLAGSGLEGIVKSLVVRRHDSHSHAPAAGERQRAGRLQRRAARVVGRGREPIDGERCPGPLGARAQDRPGHAIDRGLVAQAGHGTAVTTATAATAGSRGRQGREQQSGGESKREAVESRHNRGSPFQDRGADHTTTRRRTVKPG